jgi:hypothetical protein
VADLVNYGRLSDRVNLSGKPTYFDDGWFDPDDLVSVRPDSRVPGRVAIWRLLLGAKQTLKTE